MTNKKNTKRGVTLLIAMLVASVVLSVGVGVYNRTYKELLFASFWKQAQVAFAAADAGLECVMYWDLHPAASASCFGSAVFGWNPSLGVSTSFSMSIPYCVSIEITKNAVAPFTTIKAKGHNMPCDSGSPRLVERALRVDY